MWPAFNELLSCLTERVGRDHGIDDVDGGDRKRMVCAQRTGTSAYLADFLELLTCHINEPQFLKRHGQTQPNLEINDLVLPCNLQLVVKTELRDDTKADLLAMH